MKSKLIVLLLLVTTQLMAFTPTEEGLFRNGDIPDIKGNIVTYKIKIIHTIYKDPPAEVTQPIAQKTSSPENSSPAVETANSTADQQVTIELPQPEQITNFIKVIAIGNPDQNYQFLILFYSDPDFARQHLIKYITVPSFQRLIGQPLSILSQLNLGLLEMFTFNRSQELVPLLKKIAPNFKTNKEMMNKEKRYLYARYKKYLTEIKQNPELKDEIENPRNPEDENKKEYIKKIEQLPMYESSSDVHLVQESGKFIWQLQKDNLKATFDSTHLFLNNLSFQLTNSYDVYVQNYVLYDHLLPPKYIIMVDGKQALEVNFISYREITSPTTTFSERVEYYSKILQKMKEKPDLTNFTNLLFMQ